MTRASRVMIVEDDPNVRVVFRTAVTANDSVRSMVADGEMALRHLRQEPIDLVLLDLRMPNLDGMGLLRRLRAEGNGVPVVIITAHGDVPGAVAAMKLGVVDFLAKPLTPLALRTVVAGVLARRESPRTTQLPASSKAPDRHQHTRPRDIPVRSLLGPGR
jgi:DNA-binding NtrC family response regulator